MKAIGKIIAVVVALVVIAPSCFASQSLDELIKATHITDATKLKEGVYTIPWTTDDTTVKIYVYQETMGNSRVAVVGVYTHLAALPANYKMPQVLTDKIFELNCKYVIGRIVREGDQLLYRSYFLLENADANAFAVELDMANLLQIKFREELKPLIVQSN